MNYLQRRKQFERFGLYDSRFEHDSCGVGFVCDVGGKPSHEIIGQGLEVLRRLAHRGATGADPKTGDGAGILLQTPHAFFKEICEAAGIDLPERGLYGSGLVFLPTKSAERAYCKHVFTRHLKDLGLKLLGWRVVPVDSRDIGVTARKTQPVIEQIFVARPKTDRALPPDELVLERKLYGVRKLVENDIRASSLTQKSFFYITTISSRTFSYKGLLMPEQLGGFFPELKDKRMQSSLCVVHSRYSTNTFPTWDLAQPFRYLAHNGEINTLRGNINWMRAREGLLKSPAFGSLLKRTCPVIVPGGSDSASIDNAFELLYLAGRPLAHAMMMLIPAAWEKNHFLPAAVRDFYKYHSCFMEPWDGPAAIAFTDGLKIGAVLDRNGLRPARYILTKKNQVVMASEVGVLDIPAASIVKSGRLEPGRMFFIDTEAGRIVDDLELKEQIARARPYGLWLKKEMVSLDGLKRAKKKQDPCDVQQYLKAFGYTREDFKVTIEPMAVSAQEPIGSMGNDIPHAVLSRHPQLLYSYFKQLFAQVTNPAIDPIREEVVMSLNTYVGPEQNLLDETPAHCRKIFIEHPVLFDEELERIRRCTGTGKGFRAKTVSVIFDTRRKNGMARAIARVCGEVCEAISCGYTSVILSDRGISASGCGIPALLAVAAVHHYLVSKALRTQIGIIVESAEPREVHHFALLFGYGADCINPYLAFAAVDQLVSQERIKIKPLQARKNYRVAVESGIKKILSKMGISTLQSYRAAQIFEAVGIHEDVIERYFTGTVSRIGGVKLEDIAEEARARHRDAFPGRPFEGVHLSAGGYRQWKRDGEAHLWNPASISALQDATRTNNWQKYQEFAQSINDQSAQPVTLRSVLGFKKCVSIPVDQVEPAEEIFKRFATGAMSFGSISRAAHESLAIAMNRIKGRSNTGEGGEDPARFVTRANGDSARSAIKQVASGRFGVTTHYLVNADELQIKIAQGAKPGEGGQLPGHKVSAIIARTRYTTPGVTLISPPPHHDIYSIEDLAQLIFDLKNANPRARISVKLVSEAGVGTVAAGVAKGHADMILISGGDGGTGASPVSSIMHAGLPWELGLSETHQTLVLNDLRSRVRLQTDGQMRTGRDVAIAALLGAEEYGFCTAGLIVLGCVMLRHCHLNNCSVGIATQDEILEAKFRGNQEYTVNYFYFVARELREIMSSLGIRTMDGMIGRTDLLECRGELLPHKARHLDFSRILFKPRMPAGVATFCRIKQDHGIDDILDRRLIRESERSLDGSGPVRIESEIKNTDRTTGAMLSGEVCRRFGENGLGEDTIHCTFRGVAGQSFGAFLARGITFELEGMANDYTGKGIFGGSIIVYPDKKAQFKPGENCIIGNTTFYGAICGQAYIRGMAGERFCIRNSGLSAVVEGVGDHACEYMTGGTVVVIGPTGRNFAAGMSGGIAYVYDLGGDFRKKCNPGMVELEALSAEDQESVKALLSNHSRYTGSLRAQAMLRDFSTYLDKFIKVMPVEYKRILTAQAAGAALQQSQVYSDG